MNEETNSSRPVALGVVGALVGAVLGAFLFHLAYRNGLYMLALPGAAIGLSCGFASRIRSVPLGIVCGVVSLLTNLYLAHSIYNTDYNLLHFYTPSSDPAKNMTTK